jgi:hypothetical protein
VNDPRASGGAVALDEVPRLVAWLREDRPSTTAVELGALLADLPAARVRYLERVLDDLARGCRPPSPADLAALTELDDRLARGPFA